MQFECPHCHTSYELDLDISSEVFICHRCGVEFSQQLIFDTVTPNAAVDAGMAEPGQQEITPRSEQHEETGSQTTDQREDYSPPVRKQVRIWPWLIFMLVLAICGSFWLQQEKWLDNRWLRSTLINLNVPMTLRDKDWLILPESVHASWIERDDKSKALLIRGRVKNLLTSELPAPMIEITLFSAAQLDKVISRQRQSITLQPGMQVIRHAPFIAPAPDQVPIAPQGEREFLFLFESNAEIIADFTLTAHTP